MPKAAPAITSNDDEVDLLSDLRDEDAKPAQSVSTEDFDLLNGLDEDEGTPWLPSDDEDPSPAGIQGRVLYRYDIGSDYSTDPVPVVTLKDKNDGTIWTVRGYATALRNQITKNDPQPGDFAAFLCRGAKRSKKGRDYVDFRVLVKKP